MFLIDGFNEVLNHISSSYLKVGAEYMSVIRFWTTEKGNLSNFSYISCKPETLGAVFKTVTCSVKWAFLFIELQRGEEGMNHIK